MSAAIEAGGPDAAQLMGQTPYFSLEEIMAHPRLEAARRVFLDGLLKLHDGNQQGKELISDASRFLVFHNLILLHAAYDPGQRETWPTIGRIKGILNLYGISSDRAVDSLLSRMRDLGFLGTVPSEMDGRVRLLRPTEHALAYDRDWLVAHYAPLACLYPGHDYSRILGRDPVFQLRQRRASSAFLPLSAVLLQTQPVFLFFFAHAGGVMIEAAILQAAMESEDGNRANISFAAMARRFGLGRTHVRDVLQKAEAMGLVKLHGKGGQQVEILPALWTAHARDMAIGLYLHGMIYAKAVA